MEHAIYQTTQRLGEEPISTDDPYETQGIVDPYETDRLDDPYETPHVNDPYETDRLDDPYETPHVNDPYETDRVDDPYETRHVNDPYETYKNPHGTAHDPYNTLVGSQTFEAGGGSR